MGKFIYVFILGLLIASLFSSCDNTLDLADDKIETPIVYAMLDVDAEYQFVRLERAFSSHNTSAIELAKNPDSLYYKNAIVKLIRVRNGNKLEKTLEEINGNDKGYVRDTGVFATNPNVLYRIKTAELDIKIGDQVLLEINIGDEKLITAETKIIEKVIPISPTIGRPVSFSELQPEIIEWNSKVTTGGKVHTAEFIIKYTEEQNGVESDKELTWRLATNTEEEFVKLEGGAFYTFMANRIVKDASIKRYFNTIDFNVYSGDVNLSEFLNVVNANNGITSSGEIPVYTNLSRGYGLFGSKAITKLEGLGLSVQTSSALKTNAQTKDLNFQ